MGLAEHIPVINYLVALVDIAIQIPLSYLCKTASPENSLSQNKDVEQEQKELGKQRLRDFLQKHNIHLTTPFAKKVGEVQELWQDWKEEDTIITWETRIRLMRDKIRDLLNGANIEQQEYLNRCLDELKQTNTRVSNCYQGLQIWMQGQTGKAQEVSSDLHIVFGKLNPPFEDQTVGYGDYLASIGFADYEYFKQIFTFSIDVLLERGVETVRDFDCLKINVWDKDLHDFEQFSQILNRYKDHGNVNETYEKFLADLIKRIKEEAQKLNEVLPKANEVEPNQLNITSCMESFVKPPHTFEKFQAFVHVWRCKLLVAYILQYRNSEVWIGLKQKDLTMTIAKYKENRPSISCSALYELGMQQNV